MVDITFIIFASSKQGLEELSVGFMYTRMYSHTVALKSSEVIFENWSSDILQ